MIPRARPAPRRSVRAVRIAAGAWAVLIAALLWSSGPEVPTPWTWLGTWLGAAEEAGGDKLVHALLFGVQAWLLCSVRPGAPSAGWLAACLGATVAYGGLTEAVQAALGGRDAELADLWADAAGAAGAVAAYAWRRRPPP
jgi:hypothetical protein